MEQVRKEEMWPLVEREERRTRCYAELGLMSVLSVRPSDLQELCH